jgi:hypothetical protein
LTNLLLLKLISWISFNITDSDFFRFDRRHIILVGHKALSSNLSVSNATLQLVNKEKTGKRKNRDEAHHGVW